MQVVFALSCAACFAAPAAYGCAFHNVIPDQQLDGMYPGSLSVAIALRNAADAGVIDAAALKAAASGTASYNDTTRGLYAFAMALAAAPAAADQPASFSLGYVESRLWTRYSYVDGKVRIEIHTAGPVAGEAVVMTGEAALTALREGTLSMDDAMARGLVAIVATEADTAAIRQALTKATAPNRISLN